jgi:hypothetical protein
VNHLAPLAVDLVVQLHDARRDVDAWKALLVQALALLADRDRQLAAKQARIEGLIAENRQLRADKTQAVA